MRLQGTCRTGRLRIRPSIGLTDCLRIWWPLESNHHHHHPWPCKGMDEEKEGGREIGPSIPLKSFICCFCCSWLMSKNKWKNKTKQKRRDEEENKTTKSYSRDAHHQIDLKNRTGPVPLGTQPRRQVPCLLWLWRWDLIFIFSFDCFFSLLIFVC